MTGIARQLFLLEMRAMRELRVINTSLRRAQLLLCTCSETHHKQQSDDEDRRH